MDLEIFVLFTSESKAIELFQLNKGMFSRIRASIKVKELAELAVVTFAGYSMLDFVGNHFVFGTICSGPSMEPTINKSGDGVIVRCTQDFNVGDIVVAKCPTNPKKQICKRILAASGDIITFETDYGSIRRFQIPEGHVWLQGDNTKNSHDSRNYGPVPLGLLYGKVKARLSLQNAPYFEVMPDKVDDKDPVFADPKLEEMNSYMRNRTDKSLMTAVTSSVVSNDVASK